MNKGIIKTVLSGKESRRVTISFDVSEEDFAHFQIAKKAGVLSDFTKLLLLSKNAKTSIYKLTKEIEESGILDKSPRAGRGAKKGASQDGIEDGK